MVEQEIIHSYIPLHVPCFVKYDKFTSKYLIPMVNNIELLLKSIGKLSSKNKKITAAFYDGGVASLAKLLKCHFLKEINKKEFR